MPLRARSSRRPAALRLTSGVPLLFLVTLLPACDPGSADPAVRGGGPGTTFTTVGDTTIATTSGLDRDARAATLVEEVSVGAVDGPPEEIFGGIGAVSARPDGGAYVWDFRASELRRYGADGAYMGLVGRAGEGPGEFQHVNSMRTLPDGRTIVHDPRNMRLSVLDTGGTLLSEHRVETTMFGGPAIVAADDGSAAWIFNRLYAPNSEDAAEAYVRIPLDGSVVDTVIEPPSDVEVFETSISHPERRIRLGWKTPLAAEPVWTVGPSGEVISARSDRYRIEVARPDGTVLRIVTDAERVPVGPEERAWERDRALESARQLDPSWGWEGPPVPEVKPFFRSFNVGEGGRLWVYVHQPGESTQRENREGEIEEVWVEPIVWDVFEPDGTYLGAVRMPPRHRVATARGDTVQVVHADELGVQTLKRYRLEWPDAG